MTYIYKYACSVYGREFQHIKRSTRIYAYIFVLIIVCIAFAEFLKKIIFAFFVSPKRYGVYYRHILIWPSILEITAILEVRYHKLPRFLCDAPVNRVLLFQFVCLYIHINKYIHVCAVYALPS